LTAAKREKTRSVGTIQTGKNSATILNELLNIKYRSTELLEAIDNSLAGSSRLHWMLTERLAGGKKCRYRRREQMPLRKAENCT
jgi:hypothetical protein